MSHVTRTPLSRSPGRFGWLYWQANMDIELVTDPYARMICISCHHLQTWAGAYCGDLPPIQLVLTVC